MLIHQKTSEALDVLYSAFFDLNATLDRMCSVMLNTWCMPNASELIHTNLAHLMPVMADDISKIKDNYNISSVRYAVHEDKRDYINLQDMFDTLLDEFDNVYEVISLTIEIAKEHKNYNVQADLLHFMSKFNKVIGVVMTLSDKSKQMPTNYDTFDERIGKWGIDGLGDM